MTAEESLYHQPPDKVMRLPEGSWGDKGNHSEWINDGTRWMWYVALSIMQVLHEMPELWANCSLMNRGKAHQGHS